MSKIATQPAKKLANLRTCASCEWIYRLSDKLPETSEFHQGSCPKCGFGSYGARYVYGDKAYAKSLTQQPWLDKKMANLACQLHEEVDKTNPLKPKKRIRFLDASDW